MLLHKHTIIVNPEDAEPAIISYDQEMNPVHYTIQYEGGLVHHKSPRVAAKAFVSLLGPETVSKAVEKAQEQARAYAAKKAAKNKHGRRI